MKILFRYTIGELFRLAIILLMTFLIIVIGNQFMQLIESVSEGHITIPVLVEVMTLQAPLILGYVMPLAIYLSVLVGLTRMRESQELIIMFASGLSQRRFFCYLASVAVDSEAKVL